jgi:hypothetical protein
MSFLSKWIDAIQELFVPRVSKTVEAAAVEVAAVEAKANADVKVEVAVKKEPKKPAKKAPKSPAKAKVASTRTRKDGKFIADDKSIPDVNEAFKDGKATAKKAPAKKKPAMKIVK